VVIMVRENNVMGQEKVASSQRLKLKI
jgi:hypothetical protein